MKGNKNVESSGRIAKILIIIPVILAAISVFSLVIATVLEGPTILFALHMDDLGAGNITQNITKTC